MDRRTFSSSLGLLALGGGLERAFEAAPARAAGGPSTVHVDRSVKYQTIEGFGFFGARDSWWAPAQQLVDAEWARMVIDDLGLTMWRNEYYPPSDRSDGQGSDADWSKQAPVIAALRDRASVSRVPLKVILTVWSPPSSMKCASDPNAIYEGKPNPDGTKNGGAVCPSRRERFAEWLIDGLQLYALSGVKVYALSFQNEPLFRQPYNSGRYPQGSYADTLASIGPAIHARFPDVKLFGPEGLLDTEAGKNEHDFDPYWYTGHLLSHPRALRQLGAFAVHAYSPSMLPTATSQAARRWGNFHAAVSRTGLPTWMTETSGYVDAWEGGKNAKGEDRPGAFDLAQAIFAALYYGRVSAWLWWQGSESRGMSEFNLMAGTLVGKRYQASKHFYRFIRPGARMVRSSSEDPSVLALAFTHERLGNFVSVLINAAHAEKAVKLSGEGVPPELDAIVTSASTSISSRPTRAARDAIVLPPRSITTLIAGSYLDEPSSTH
jgi:glucuronoarabinoxylan endo-1,4-beta-xylanase